MIAEHDDELRFEISRRDGRSNAQVILDLVRDKSPGTIYSFGDLGEALGEGTDRIYDRKSIGGIVRSALPRMLREQQRLLHSVRGVGYRLALASEHNQLALDRRRKADVQLRRGLDVVRHVRWDELDEATRKITQGTLMIMGALYENQKALEKRQENVEETIQRLVRRVDQIAPEAEV